MRIYLLGCSVLHEFGFDRFVYDKMYNCLRDAHVRGSYTFVEAPDALELFILLLKHIYQKPN